MKRFLLSVYQPKGDPPAPEVLETIMRDLDFLNQELKAAGAWVFTGGLHAPSTATVVRHRFLRADVRCGRESIQGHADTEDQCRH